MIDAVIEKEEPLYKISAGGKIFGGMRKVDTWNGFVHYRGSKGECYVVGNTGGLEGFLNWIDKPLEEGTVIMASGEILKALGGNDGL